MRKLFEIPIYALSRKELDKRIKKDRTAFITKNNHIPEDIAVDVFDNKFTLYKRNWDYNHIVGYIQIFKQGNNLKLELYLIVEPQSKYYWKSNRKKFLRKQFTNGCNIYLGQYENNIQVSKKLDCLLNDLKKNYIPSRYYIDTETYDNTKEYIDYKGI